MKPFCCVLTLFSLAVCLPVHAHNNLFLPGDAYFSARFDTAFFEQQKTDGKLEFTYYRYAGEFMACGYAGYENITVKGVSETMRQNLEKVHAKLFKDYRMFATKKGTAGESAPDQNLYFPIFVHSHDFPLDYPFGLKFNENWVEEQTKQAKRGHAIYDDLGNVDLIEMDLASARDVGPLRIDAKRTALDANPESGIVREPVTAKASNVRFIIFAGHSIADFSRKMPDLEVFVVDEKIIRFVFDDDGTARSVPFDAPPNLIGHQRLQALKDMVELKTAVAFYEKNHGVLPSSIHALVKKPAPAPKGWMQTLRTLPKDPWGHDYVVDEDRILCLGPDGLPSEDDLERY